MSLPDAVRTLTEALDAERRTLGVVGDAVRALGEVVAAFRPDSVGPASEDLRAAVSDWYAAAGERRRAVACLAASLDLPERPLEDLAASAGAPADLRRARQRLLRAAASVLQGNRRNALLLSQALGLTAAAAQAPASAAGAGAALLDMRA